MNLQAIPFRKEVTFLRGNLQFTRMLFAQFISGIGNQLHRFALPWLIYDVTGSGTAMAANFTVSLIPGMVFGIVGGTLADRFPKRKVLLYGDLMSSIVTLLLILFWSIGHLNATVIYVVTFLLSALAGSYSPAFDAAVPEVVERDSLVQANSMFTLSSSFVSLGGPVLSGILLGFFGPFVNIVLNAISFLIAAFFIWRIDGLMEARASKATWGAQIMEGIAYIKGQLWAVIGILVIFTVYIGIGGIGSLMQYFLRVTMGLPANQIGVTFTLFEFLPMFLMGLLMPKLSKKFHNGTLLWTSIVIYGISLLLLGSTINYIVVVLSAMLTNFAAVVLFTTWVTVRQRLIPEVLRGRVMGAMGTLTFMGLPIGGAMASATVELVGPNFVFMVSGGMILVAGLVSRFSPMGRLQ